MMMRCLQLLATCNSTGKNLCKWLQRGQRICRVYLSSFASGGSQLADRIHLMGITKLASFCITMLFTKVAYALRANQYSSLIARAARSELSLFQRRGKGDSTSLLSSHLSKETMNSLTKRVQENNDMKNGSVVNDFALFALDSVVVGYVSKRSSDILSEYPETFEIKRETAIKSISLTPDLIQMTLADRSAAVEIVTKDLKAKKIITGWRDELLPVVDSFSDLPVFLVERAAIPFFGFKAYGVHVNGFVRDAETNKIMLWVAKRSKTKSTFPGMLDHIVAGGLPYGITPMDNVIKECEEEASIPEDLARLSKATGYVSYVCVDSKTNLKRDTLFCYDLELPSTFIPKPMDGEVESFELRDLEWVLDKIIKGGPEGYKPNCNLVVIDFLVRHGVITPECPNYLALVHSLRGTLDSINSH